MKHYTSIIPFSLAEKLKEKGMPILIEQEWYPNGMPKAEKDCHKPMTKYCEVFDWLMEKGLFIRLSPSWDSPSDGHLNFEYRITRMEVPFKELTDNVSYGLARAANAAIEKALELI